jgi:hypothetical protein
VKAKQEQAKLILDPAARQKLRDKGIQHRIRRITDEDQFFHMLATVDKLGKAIAKLKK